MDTEKNKQTNDSKPVGILSKSVLPMVTCVSNKKKNTKAKPAVAKPKYTYQYYRSTYYRRPLKGFWEFWSEKEQTWKGVHNFSLKRQLTRHTKTDLWIIKREDLPQEILQDDVIEDTPTSSSNVQTQEDKNQNDSMPRQFGSSNLDLEQLQ